MDCFDFNGGVQIKNKQMKFIDNTAQDCTFYDGRSSEIYRLKEYIFNMLKENVGLNWFATQI